MLGMLSSMVLVVSCSGPEKEQDSEEKPPVKVTPHDLKMAQGFEALSNTCLACHRPNLNEGTVAPNLAVLKSTYVSEGVELEQLSKKLGLFLDNPRENAVIAEAVAQYGPMPKMNVSPDEAEAIAYYLYHTPLEDSSWYEGGFEKQQQRYSEMKDLGTVDYLAKGRKLAMATKGVLGKNLLGAIKEKGTSGALTFCNERAYPLTDSMSLELNATIKRVSDKNRNPNNAANEEELEVISRMKSELIAGQKPQAELKDWEGHLVGYYPIMTNDMCMQCHGEPQKQVLPETLDALTKLYPEDKAVGYSPNQLRGIWVVRFSEDNK
ncbi:DUF3365 domain-containing protein [bacterium SCSIO 12741]|nr:DUF3365 domain-containing protein [bacterium SCSIO 12741]